MIKKAVWVATFIILAAAAVYSYDQARFGDRTVSFFRVAVFSDGEGRSGRSGRGFGRGGNRDLERIRGRPVSDDSVHADRQSGESFERMRKAGGDTRERLGDRRAPRGDTEDTMMGLRERSGEFRGRGGHGHRGAAVSLEEVGYYTIIFAFATMLTYTMDGLARRTKEL